MTCWEILGITSDADKKAIKLAYAKRLKQTRPEDDPEGFKHLYEAYQQALDWQSNDYYNHYDNEQTASEPESSQPPVIHEPVCADSTLTSVWAEPNEPLPTVAVSQAPLISELPDTKPVLTELHLTPPLIQTEVEGQSEPPTKQYYLSPAVAPDLPEPALFNDDLKFDEDWQFFLHGCSTALHTEAARTDPSYWYFLKTIPSLTNLEFKEQASLKLFSYIADANLIALEQKTLYIKPVVLNYLNEVFDWEYQANYLTQHFSLTKVDAVLTYIDNQLASINIEAERKRIYPKVNQELLFWKRMGAIVLDFLLALLILVFGAMITLMARTYGMEKVLEAKVINIFTILFLLYVILVMPTLEIIYQASPGQRLLGLKIVNQYGEKIKWYQAFWRHLLVIISLVFRGLWLANLIMIWRRKLFLHDYFSRSYVIENKSANSID